MTLSQSDLYTLALAQGLTPDRAKVAAAVAMAESGGNPNAHNYNKATGDDSWGLWQINMLGDLGPERLKLFNIQFAVQLADPGVNAKAMAILSKKGTDFNDWTTFKNGSYLKFMGNAVSNTGKDFSQSMFEQKTGVKLPDWVQSDNPLAPLQALNDAVAKLTPWITDSKNWVRIAYVVGGGVLVIGALVTLVSNTKAGAVATKVATKGLV